ncbi:MAG: hypothetical protein ABA06_04120 [Parcubacteria bacterium C7867-001]|nr:MAG: hypothetical protein ABA06_04120 [Parcubacteria bacterium C7867-001]
MEDNEFKAIVEDEWTKVPARFAKHIQNVALLIEDEPNEDIRAREGLSAHDTLLGLYQGIPNIERGSLYGVGPTMPDTITLFRLPILEEAHELTDTDTSLYGKMVRKVVRETLWHEIGHYLGLDEAQIHEREEERTNDF